MKRELNLTIKSMLTLLIAMFLVGVFMFYAIILLIDYSQRADDTASATISFIGNIVGGVIGGIAAYLVAAFQINSTINNEGKRTLSTSYSTLRFVKSEIINNKNIVTKFKSDFATGINLDNLQSISSVYWDKSTDKLGIEVSDETITKTIGCYAMIDAYKRQIASIPEANSDSLITKINETIAILELDINTMKTSNNS